MSIWTVHPLTLCSDGVLRTVYADAREPFPLAPGRAARAYVRKPGGRGRVRGHVADDGIFYPRADHAGLLGIDPAAPLYGVSYGNGNDGVSHLWPYFYVRTADPYTLAAAALLDLFGADYQTRYARRLRLEGEAEFAITASIDDPIGSAGWSEVNGTWKICEVFPVDAADVRPEPPQYISVKSAVTPGALLRARRYCR